MSFLTIENVSKVYPNGTKAVHDANIQINSGEFVVFVGPSGCGKSTLLRMIAGLENVTEGEINLDRKTINKMNPADRDVAMVFQNYALYPHMTVYRNMAYGLKNRKINRVEIDEKVRKAAELLRIDDLLKRKPAQLSGGQRQRVAMGRAIVRNPKLFLFDEPLSNLDAKLRVQMRMEIKQLQQEMGITSIFVTHDQVEAMTLADRLAVIRNGQIEQIGTPLEVYQRPRTLFVAEFIGSPAMNLLPADWNAEAGTIALSSKLSLSVQQKTGTSQSINRVVMGIRPEHLEVCDSMNEMIGVKVLTLERLGADTIVYGNLKDSEKMITVRLSGNADLSRGDELSLCFNEEHLHFFSQEEGIRL